MAREFPNGRETASLRTRSLADPGRSGAWTSERIWRWLTPAERARMLVTGGYVSMRETPLAPQHLDLNREQHDRDRDALEADVQAELDAALEQFASLAQRVSALEGRRT